MPGANQTMTRFTIFAAAMTLSSVAIANDSVELGRKIAEANCSPCHAVSTHDVSNHPEAPPLRELSKRYPIDALEEAFVEGIYSGHPDMPQFEATEEQTMALLNYLGSIQD